MASSGFLARSSRLLLPLLSLLLLSACGESQVSAPPAEPEAIQISGTYRVEGITTVIGTELSREIAGTVVLDQDGGRYTATFDMMTDYPGPDGALPAEVVGTGEGMIEGTSLKGIARTQILTSRVPGIDPGFTLVPAAFGVRVVSDAEGTVKEDGSISFKLENRGEEGEDYVPTRTTVTGARVAD